MNKEDSDDNEEMEEAHVRVPQRRVRGPAVAPTLIWLNMVNAKPSYLSDLKIESMKKFWIIKRILRNFLVNCYVICNNLSLRNIWIYC